MHKERNTLRNTQDEAFALMPPFAYPQPDDAWFFIE